VRLGPDKASESVLLKNSGLKVDALEVWVARPGAGIRRQRVVGARLVEVSVRDVPLALPEGFVTRCTEPVSESGNRVWLQLVEVLLNSRLC